MSLTTRIAGLAVLAALVASPVFAGEEQDFGPRPDWEITVNGETHSAADYDGDVLIVDFWASWCPPCRKEIPGFINLQNKYKEQGLTIIGFSFDRDAETHDQWVADNGMNYASFWVRNDQGQAVVEAFQDLIGEIKGIPTTLVINREGEIVYKHVGYAPESAFEEVITPLLAGSEEEGGGEDATNPATEEVSSFAVEGMTCGGCAASVEKAVTQLDGVVKIDVDVEGKSATVVFDPAKVTVAAIEAAIDGSGFEATQQN